MTALSATFAYNLAYLHRIDWKKVFPNENALNFLKKECSELGNARLDILIGTLLANVSAALGPRTRIEVRSGFDLQPNLYLIIVADSGSGKTPVFKKFCSSVLSEIEKTDGGKRFVINEFTRPALLKLLNSQRGFGYML